MAAITRSRADSTINKHIRHFDPRRDMQVVADLIERCFAETLDQDSKRYLQQMRDFSRDRGFLAWLPLLPEWAGAPFIGYVWEEEGAVVGNVSLIPYRVADQRAYMIANVAVDPDYRKRGIARKLTLQAVEHTKRRNADQVWLNVRDRNEVARRLYASLGFQERGRRTIWHGSHQHGSSDTPVTDISIRTGTSSYWSRQKVWLSHNYPAQFAWHLPVNLGILGPSLWSKVRRALSTSVYYHWSATLHGQLLASAFMQDRLARANTLILAAPPEPELNAIAALLAYVCRHLPPGQTVTLEYPSGEIDPVIRSAGFSAQQTLVWMELEGSPERGILPSMR